MVRFGSPRDPKPCPGGHGDLSLLPARGRGCARHRQKTGWGIVSINFVGLCFVLEKVKRKGADRGGPPPSISSAWAGAPAVGWGAASGAGGGAGWPIWAIGGGALSSGLTVPSWLVSTRSNMRQHRGAASASEILPSWSVSSCAIRSGPALAELVGGEEAVMIGVAGGEAGLDALLHLGAGRRRGRLHGLGEQGSGGEPGKCRGRQIAGFSCRSPRRVRDETPSPHDCNPVRRTPGLPKAAHGTAS